MILMITNKNDLTSDFVAFELNKVKASYYRLNTEDLFNHIDIEFNFKEDKFLIIDNLKNIKIDLLKDIKSVYFRRPELPTLDYIHSNKSEKEFLAKESYYSLEGLYSILNDKLWMSHPNYIRVAENKILQLLTAKKIGFKIPESLISSKQNLSFLKNKRKIIKPIKTGLLENKKGIELIYTNKITDAKLQENYVNFPSYIQEEIVNKVDIRVTVVKSQIFAVKISLNDLNKNEIDWRKGKNKPLAYEIIELPDEIKIKCLQLLNEFHLNFGAIDLALDKDNNFIFFEINPNGQWAWLEKNLKLKISKAIVKALQE